MPFAACWAPLATVSFTDSAGPLRDTWLRGVRLDRVFVLLADRDLGLLVDRALVLLPDRAFVVFVDRAFVVDDRLDRPFVFELADRDRVDPEDPEPLAVLVFVWAIRTLLRVDVSSAAPVPGPLVTMHTDLPANIQPFRRRARRQRADG